MPTLKQRARFFVTLAKIVIACHYVSAQHNAAIKTHTFGALNGLFTLSFEQAFGKHFSGQLSVEGGTYIKMRPNRTEDYKAKGAGVIGALRYYPFIKRSVAPEGFFTYAAFRKIRFDDTYTGGVGGSARYEGGGSVLNIGGGVGYKFVYRRLGIEGFVGWGSGRLKRDDDASFAMPEFYRMSMNEEKHFPQLDVTLCYMLTTFSGRKIRSGA